MTLPPLRAALEALQSEQAEHRADALFWRGKSLPREAECARRASDLEPEIQRLRRAIQQEDMTEASRG